MQTPASIPRQSQVTAAADKVPVPEKIVYGFGTVHDMWGHWLYPTIGWQVFNIFLGVAPWLVGVALFLNRLFDAASDAIFGWLSDNTRTRWGRRRPYILIAGVLAGVGLPLLLAVAPGWGSSTVFGAEVPHYFWFMVISSAIYLPIMSAFKMPFDCLGYEMTPDYHERTSVWSFRNAVQKVPELGLFFAAQFMTMSVWVGASGSDWFERVKRLFTESSAWRPAAEGTRPNMLLGAQVYTVALGLIMVVLAVVMFAVLRERYYGKVTERKQGNIPLRETLGLALKCKPFRMQIAMKLSYAMGTSMVGALGYFATLYYVCRGNLAEGAVWNFWMGISGMVLGFAGIPVFAGVARRFGKRVGLMSVLAVAVVVFAATWWLYDPEIRWLQVFASGLIAFTGAGFAMLEGSIGADVIDYDELETGQRREGVFAACGSWIMKVGMAVGAGASGVILSLTGFDAELGGAQTDFTILMIRLLLAGIPIVGMLVALVMIYSFPLTPERMADIRRQLEARRGTV